MTSDTSLRPVSALRARMIEDMRVRGFSEKTRNDYIRNVRAFAAFSGRSPDTATAEDLRRFQHHRSQTGVRPPSINSAVAALRFFFTVTLDRADLARRLTIVREPRRLPTVLNVEEVILLFAAAPGPKYKAAFATAYGGARRSSGLVTVRIVLLSTQSACYCRDASGLRRSVDGAIELAGRERLDRVAAGKQPAARQQHLQTPALPPPGAQ